MKLANALRNKSKNSISTNEATFTCTKCGNTYTMSVGELCWYYDMGNIIPDLCDKCRKEKKEAFLAKKNNEEVKEEIVE